MNKPQILHKLRTIRKKRFTQVEMAKALGCAIKDYALKERGKKPITTDEWLKISEIVDIPVGMFFMNVSTNIHKEFASLIYGYNRLSQKGKMTLKIVLNNFLLSQRSVFEDKMRKKEQVLFA